jgi:hypothetical protein
VEELGRRRPKQLSNLSLVFSCSLFLSFSHVQEERLNILELAKSHSKKKNKNNNNNATRSVVAATRATAPQRRSVAASRATAP